MIEKRRLGQEDRERRPHNPTGKGTSALGSPGARWVLAHTFTEGHRNAACEALAIAYRWDGRPFSAALREVMAWGRVHLPGYTDREMADVLKSNYRRDRPFGLSSRRLLALRDSEGVGMSAFAAAASCAATDGPPLRNRKALSARVKRPLLEELANALSAVRAGTLRGVLSNDDAARVCEVSPCQFTKHVKPSLIALGLALVSSRKTYYGPTPRTYWRLSRAGVLQALARDAQVLLPEVVHRILSLYSWLLTRVNGLCAALRSQLRLLWFGVSGFVALAEVGYPETAPQSWPSRSPPEGVLT